MGLEQKDESFRDGCLLDALPDSCLWEVLQLLTPVERHLLGRAWKPSAAATRLKVLPVTAFCGSTKVGLTHSYSTHHGGARLNL